MKHISLLLAFLFLTACAPPRQVTTAVAVKVPYPVFCKVTLPPAPAWHIPQDPASLKVWIASANMAEKAKATLADLDLSRGYMAELKAAIAGCNSEIASQ